jgi:hypothetical protein
MATLDQINLANKINTLEQMLLTAKPGGLKSKVLTNQIARLQQELSAQAPKPNKLVITKRAVPLIAPKPTKPSNDVVFLGKTYKIGKNEQYKSIVQVAKKLNVNVNDLKAYRENQNKKRVFDKDTSTIEIDLRKKKPLLMREFGISRISNKELIKETNTIKRQGQTIKIYNELPQGTEITVFIEAYYWIQLSAEYIRRKAQHQTTIKTGDNIEQLVRERLYNYWGRTIPIYAFIFEPEHIASGNEPLNIPGFVDGFKITRNNQGGQTMKLQNMILRDEHPTSLKNMYSNVIEDQKWKHCIHDYMLEVYNKKYSKATLSKLNTTEDIYNFCVDKGIKMIAYDITGKCILSNYPDKDIKKKSLFFIAHNNHLYPLKSQYLSKVKPIIQNIEIVDDCKARIINLVENENIYPSSIELNGSEIVSYIDRGIKYIENPEYLECKAILETFGIADKIFDSISYITLGQLLKDLYITTSDKSVFIGHDRFVKGGFNYSNNEIEGKMTTIDANKFYPSCLKDLKFLITVDMIRDDFQEYQDNELLLDEDHYLYIAVPKFSTILMPDTNCYSGEFLKYCKNEGLEFTIIEKIRTTSIPNHYTEFLNDLYKKVSDKQFKKIINPLIGQFENATEKYSKYFKQFANNDELKTIEDNQYIHSITNNLHMVCDVVKNINIYNRKPIAIQLKDESRKRLYEMMKKLKLNDTNIKSINTDAITFIGDANLPKNIIGRNMGQWKLIENKNVNATFNYTDNLLSFMDSKAWISPSTIGNCYAGCGKSYKIINEHIPECAELYIVLTPSHSALKEYRAKGLNCDVIQTYEYSHEIPDAKTIIIDELGMVSLRGMHLIYEWYLYGKNIIAYGDFNQLLPVNENETLDSSIFINSVYYNQVVMDKNYRNNFSRLFYDSIINGCFDNTDVIKQYRNISSNNVICYRNKTCEKYNRIIADRLGIRDKFSVGARVICNTNELREKKIYNKFVFTVIEEFEDYVILDGNIKIDKRVMNKKEGDKEYFSLAYARTLHSVQGESLPDIYFPDDDLEMISGNNRFCYTLISRLKGNQKAYMNNIDYVC